MIRRKHLVLALLGLILVGLSLALLAYALWPLDPALQRIPLPPEPFRRPGAWLPTGRGIV